MIPKTYHGSDAVRGGRLHGATDAADYFYFTCPHCPEDEILQVLDFKDRTDDDGNKCNDLKQKAPRPINIAFELYCERCKFNDFVKVSNCGWQGGKLDDARWRTPGEQGAAE